MFPQVHQSLIYLKIFEESWLTFVENFGCLGKFLQKNLGRYQRFFKKFQRIMKKKTKIAKIFSNNFDDLQGKWVMLHSGFSKFCQLKIILKFSVNFFKQFYRFSVL